ncbi:MAG: SIS domain-containing protein [Thermoplasmatota archaeon]|nr:SIS domain-containing protein [Candidatus Thermoplasmatota archaeon]MBU1914510.1 SIS domain-containing protein [Candidatus Thermoplasmatota archaeon]
MRESVDYIVNSVQTTLESDIENTDKFVDLIIGSRKIFIYGVGRSGLIAKAFAIRLVQMGLEVFFVGETVTPFVEEGNLVIIVSYTGETMSAIQTANIVRRVGAKVVTVTANNHSKLAAASNLIIEIHPPKDDDRKRLAPLGTLFEVATLIYLDGIVASMMEKLGQSEGAMRKRHAIWV